MADDEGMLLILERYKAQGALSADDLIDKMYPKDKPVGVNALAYIIQNELDADGSLFFDALEETKQCVLSKIVSSVANALSLSSEFPQQARIQARQVLDYIGSQNVDIPTPWSERMEEIANLSALRSSFASPPPSNGAREKWQAIVANDRNAPPVMSNSILPMIGLEEVKNKFVNIYHRLQVAKDQGDSTAASYNVRFEGNPGTGTCV